MTLTLEAQPKQIHPLVLTKASLVKKAKLHKAQVEMAKKPQN